jgi:hypothetical protein
VPARRWSGAQHPQKIQHRIGEYRVMSGLLINLIIQVISGAIGGKCRRGGCPSRGKWFLGGSKYRFG